MLRAILSKDLNGQTYLDRDELHHLVKVRRLRPGEEFLALSIPEKQWFRCRLQGDTGPGVDLIREEPCATEPRFRLTLAQALIQRDRFESVLQKSVELGVVRIVPLETRRTELKLSAERGQKLTNRWEKIVREAVKQCGRSSLPRVEIPTRLDTYLSHESSAFKLCLDERTGSPLNRLFNQSGKPDSCGLLIGPEGGWEADERELITRSGFRVAHLGARILRSDTAAIALLGVLQYEFGDFADSADSID